MHRHLGTWTKKGTKIGFYHIQPLNKDIRSLRAKSIALYLIKNVSGSLLYLFQGAKSWKKGYCHLGTDFDHGDTVINHLTLLIFLLILIA